MSSSNNSLALIEKLTGRDNYATWRFAVKTYLEHEELWDCVEPSNPSQEIDKKRDTKARSKIILLVDPVNYIHIQESSTAKEVWNNLSRAFDDSGLTRRVGLLRDLCNTTLAGCSNVEEYVSKIMTTAHKLRNIGFHVDDEWLGTLLLSGLPESYKPMIIAIESSGMKISSDSIKSKILQDVKQNESDLTAFASSQKFHNKNKSFSKGPRCYTCNKYGHKSPECKSKPNKYQKNKESKQNQSSYAAVFIASSGYSDDWYIDSGASVHMTKHKNLFIEETTPDIKTIKVANNKSLPVQSSGKISLCVDNERARYFVTFLDDYSKKIFVYVLHNKSEVLEKIIEFKKLVENQLSRTIKILRTDNGLEYVNRKFSNFHKNAGIIHQTTTPYTPEQNGTAERMNRTLIERAKCMMLNAKLPKVYWAEAIHTAAYIINRSPTKSLCYKTPEEMWTGQKPNVSHMRTFGCEAMVHLPKEKRKKLDSKSQKLIFIGYCENTKGYRFILPNSRKAIKSRDAIFLESTVKRDYVPIELTTNECSIQNKDCEELSSDDSFNAVTENKSQSDSEYFPDESIESSPERNITVRTRRQYKLASQEQEENSYLCFDEQLNNEVPDNYEEAMKSVDASKWITSIKEELDAHQQNKTWTLVDKTPDMRIIGCKWVFRIKEESSGLRYKSRLCAKGYSQTKGIDYQETFAPTVRYDSIRLLLSEAAQHNLQIIQLDIKTAFLYGELEEDIYMAVPEGLTCKTNKVCKLNKSLYGLKQSPRCWNSKFDSVLKKFGLVNSKADQCVYVGTINGENCYLCLYVDDGLIFSKNRSTIKELINDLQSIFEVKTFPVRNFVGMEIMKSDSFIFIHQSSYIEKLLNKFMLNNSKPNSIPADPHTILEKGEGETEKNIPYREAVGSLMHLATVSRSDISFAVSLVSRFLNSYNETHWNAVKKIFKYLKETKVYGLYFTRTTEPNVVIGYSDADFANDPNTRHSVTGYVFIKNGGAVTWACQKQQTVALSTTEAEFMAACAATKEVMWIKQLLSDIGEFNQKSVCLNLDNQSAISVIKNTNFHNIKEKYYDKIIELNYVCSDEQYADIFTKPLCKIKFCYLRDKIGVKSVDVIPSS
ncbi:hypothetical protein ABMA27_015190 [Loxostege sticticalis]|uniref:Retrovirus-related Pol polyprotein from transposon TNT 1-94 n=1 Tax=Loxostege sticticalis TaxID=481309 RepID=A0ABR3I6T5_LOXSC